ncbi:MAG: flap endonuclease-1 [Candidatus Woesearchaeota archaeon]
MGSAITSILESKTIKIEDLAGKALAVDSYNQLYMFITTIRQPDGTPLKDSNGNVTSHLSGLFFRFTKLMEQGIKFAFVFDGKVPELKKKEQERRHEVKQEALHAFKQAQDKEDLEGMKKYAGRTSVLTKEMREEAIQLIEALGCPVIEAPSEGEAQAAQLVKEGTCYAVMSQDADALLFGAPRSVKNLSITGRRRKPGQLGTYMVEPELITLTDTLKELKFTQEKLIYLAMLVGTDYNIKGIKGIGPKKALKLVQENDKPEDIFKEAKWDEHFEQKWQEVFALFKNTDAKKDLKLEWKKPDKDEIVRILCEEHDFSKERVEQALDKLSKGTNKQQKGLGEFF